MKGLKKKRKLLLLGYLGLRNNQLDGQTVKTRDILRLVQSRYTTGSVVVFDTQRAHYNPFLLLLLLWHLSTCQTLIYIPAHNSLKYFSKPILFLSRCFKFNVLHVLVGGWLPEYLRDNPSMVKTLSSFSCIFAQTEKVMEELVRQYKFGNVCVLHNFRFQVPEAIPRKSHEGLKIVFMARINLEKGLDWMRTLSRYIDEKYQSGLISIDFYGPIMERDKELFQNILRECDCTSYGGVLDPSEITQTLTDYDVLVLPTHYYTEGFPGSVLDAYIAGIPVIVTEWKHAKEFVDDTRTGFIIPFDRGEDDLCRMIDYLFSNPKELERMKKEAALRSRKYSVDAAWRILEPYLA